MTKKTSNKSTKPRASQSNKKVASRSESIDQSLRDHLHFLLKGGGAHISFDDAISGWPPGLVGVKIAKFPHTAWMLLEHMRIAQSDIVEFSRSARHVSPKWPEEYWPKTDAPSDEKAWTASMDAFRKDLRTMERLVADHQKNLYARIPWGDGQTILRETLLLADHNAYHLGQLVTLRKGLGI